MKKEKKKNGRRKKEKGKIVYDIHADKVLMHTAVRVRHHIVQNDTGKKKNITRHIHAHRCRCIIK